VNCPVIDIPGHAPGELDLLRELLDNAPYLIGRYDRALRVLYVNAAMRRALRLAATQIVGNYVGDIEFDPALRRRWLDAAQRVLASGKTTRFTFELNGRQFDTRLSPVGGRTVSKGIIEFTQERSDRAIVEQALEQSEARFRGAFDDSGTAMALADLTGRVTRVNPACCEMLGYSAGELIGARPEQLTDPRDVALHNDQLGKLVAGVADKVQFEKRYRKKSGEIFWGIVNLAVVRDKHGAPAALVTQIQDISRRRAAEIALQDSEARFSAFMRHMPAAAFMKDAVGRYVFANDVAAEVSGHPISDLIGRTDRAVFPLDRAMPIERVDQRVLESGEAQQFVEPLPGDGEPRHLLTTKFPIPSATEHGPLLGGITLDITARVAAENALKQSEEKYRRVFDTAFDAVIVFDPTSEIIIDANLKVSELLGHRHVEIIGSRLDRFLPVPADADKIRYASLNQGHAAELELINRTGERLPVEVRATPIRFGERLAAHAVLRDLRAERAAQAELLASEARLQQLAANVADAIWICSEISGRVLYVNAAYETVFGRQRAELLAGPGSWLEEVAPEDVAIAAADSLDVGAAAPHVAEFRLIALDGAARWVRKRTFRFGRGDRLVCRIVEDISARRLAEEERLAFAQRQRDALVREVHHRIKNHLQGVVGLLRQHAGGHPESSSAFEAVIAQIQAVATVHGLRSKSPHQGVDLHAIVAAIAGQVSAVTGRQLCLEPDHAIHESADLKEDDAVPSALILNELMMNAVKHCSTGGGISIIRDPDGDTCIAIENRGSLPVGFDFAAGRGLGTGLELVRALSPYNGVYVQIQQATDRVRAELRLAARDT
jgi:PAS domain S-box-containing protein